MSKPPADGKISDIPSRIKDRSGRELDPLRFPSELQAMLSQTAKTTLTDSPSTRPGWTRAARLRYVAPMAAD